MSSEWYFLDFPLSRQSSPLTQLKDLHIPILLILKIEGALFSKVIFMPQGKYLQVFLKEHYWKLLSIMALCPVLHINLL